MAAMNATRTKTRRRIDMDMTEAKLFERIETLLQKLEEKAIPLSEQLWDNADVARYFKRNPQVVRETITCQPSFPKAIRLPSKGKAHPLYNAGEVVEWAKKYREKN
jgi:hypothetical protein